MAMKFGPLIRELRIHLCQTSQNSKGVRDFLQKHYVPLKNANRDFPILVRECKGAEPRIWARYAEGIEMTECLADCDDKGNERSAPLHNLSADDVANTLKRLVN